MTVTVASTDLKNSDFAPGLTPITTGAAPVDANPAVRYYVITTGGTAGEEVFNVPLPDLPLIGTSNAALAGARMIIALVAQTDESDVVKITAGGSATLKTFKYFDLNNTLTDVTLGYEGACVCLVWAFDAWRIDPEMTNWDFSYASDFFRFGLSLDGGGDFSLGNLPTADPHVENVVWSNNGVLTVSAG